MDPLGRVAPRGQRTLTPTVTTTYTLSVTGAGNSADKRTVTVVVAGTMAGASPSDAAAAGRRRRCLEPPTANRIFSGVYGYGAAAAAAARRRPLRAGSLPTTPTLKPGAEKFRVVRAR